ncbi:hypothetical protein JOB18_005063 [Solea senegalensis]|uniref:Uncharacterized protein n=1 Tax=Solea senegalensis TaxID=28829 RepID=A0AAV6QSA0_SOLSE|nr:hypothetical protein JOB18_005063 [Solea senegalensis]
MTDGVKAESHLLPAPLINTYNKSDDASSLSPRRLPLVLQAASDQCFSCMLHKYSPPERGFRVTQLLGCVNYVRVNEMFSIKIRFHPQFRPEQEHWGNKRGATLERKVKRR